MSLLYVDSSDVRAALPYDRAIAAIEDALRTDVDPEVDSPRLFSPAPDGEFLLMPTAGGRYSGVKVATIAPLNPARGLEKIQAVYLLFDSVSLAPLAALDGTTLTAIRTPATTLTAVKHIAAAPGGEELPAEPHVVVIGAGVQALEHVRAARAVFAGARFTVVGRSAERVERLVATLTEEGVPVRAGSRDEAVRTADVVLCVTSSTEPVFDGALPGDHAIVASVGAHGLDAREVDPTLVRRADVVVEGRESSWRESGNLLSVADVDHWRAMELPNLRDLVAGRFRRTPGRPALYTGVGMAWEDIVLASVAYEAAVTARVPSR